MNLLVAMATDRILGEEANYTRANMLRQLLHEVDEKENKTTWNIQSIGENASLRLSGSESLWCRLPRIVAPTGAMANH